MALGNSAVSLVLPITKVLSTFLTKKRYQFSELFSLENDCSRILITKLTLTRRQYYSIMQKLINHTDLLRGINGNYSLTSIGEVIFSMLVKIESAIKYYYWKVKGLTQL
jgi:hypothetical protein